MNDSCPRPQSITILGSTGSIGESTLDVIQRYPGVLSVYALTAHQSVDKLFQQCLQFHPSVAVMLCPDRADELRSKLQAAGSETQVLSGAEGLIAVSRCERVDTVMAAIVGAAGLSPTLAAVTAGKKVLLANKESLVMAGQLFMDAVAASGACLLPVDSEHNAIFQCLAPPSTQVNLAELGVSKLILTGSGGPLRTTPLADLAQVTPDQACAHPNWSMGRKISVDSATMLNKGLEYIEARWLFSAGVDAMDIVIHPQSIVHSMVQYNDGSVLAQMGQPDMRIPIAHVLAWPQRIPSGVGPLDLTQVGRLDFEAPDFERFPGLRLAIEASRRGGSLPIALNAANEIAVEAFLAERVPYTGIVQLIEWVLERTDHREPEDLDQVQSIDMAARNLARERLSQLECRH